MNLLSITWYFEYPFDYEIKQYNLLAYLRNVEDSFLQKKLSPHLLHLEKMENELISFKSGYEFVLDSFNQKKYQFFENEEVKGLDDNDLSEIVELVDFSLPQINSKIKMGHKILKTHNQILY